VLEEKVVYIKILITLMRCFGADFELLLVE